MARTLPSSIDETQKLSLRATTSPGSQPRTSLFLALAMRRPLFLEGGRGRKTEIGKVIAPRAGPGADPPAVYEGLTSRRRYEWNYSRQMIEIRLAEAAGEKSKESSGRYLLREIPDQRPLARPWRPLAGPAHRRARPHRRALRGLPASRCVGLADHDSRSRHGCAPPSRRSWSSPPTGTREIH